MQQRIPELLARLTLAVLLPLWVGAGCSLDGSENSTADSSDSSSSSSSDSSSASTGDTAPSNSSTASSSTSSSGKVLAIGDSITAGYGVSDAYPAKLGRILGKSVVAAGKSGENTDGGAARISGLMDTHKPSTVVIMEGTNDANRNKDLNAAASNLGKIIDVAKAKGAKAVVICTIPPLTGPKAGRNDNVKALNSKIKALAASKGVRLADCNAGMSSSALQSDGIHPNNNGHAIIAVTVAEAL